MTLSKHFHLLSWFLPLYQFCLEQRFSDMLNHVVIKCEINSLFCGCEFAGPLMQQHVHQRFGADGRAGVGTAGRELQILSSFPSSWCGTMQMFQGSSHQPKVNCWERLSPCLLKSRWDHADGELRLRALAPQAWAALLAAVRMLFPEGVSPPYTPSPTEHPHCFLQQLF